MPNAKKPVVVLKWSTPILLEDAIKSRTALVTGVYCIIRRYGSNETNIYIGKSVDGGIKSRLQRHLNSEKTEKQGKYYASFVDIPVDSVFDDYDRVVEDIETLLIYDAQPKCNKQKRKPPVRLYNMDFIIKNAGYKLPKVSAVIDAGQLAQESVDNPKKVVIKPCDEGKNSKNDDDEYVFADVFNDEKKSNKKGRKKGGIGGESGSWWDYGGSGLYD